jgi:hypothetical protein
MALLFMDGFDHYTTSDLFKKWNTGGAGTTVDSGQGRRSTGALRISNTGSFWGIGKAVSSESYVIGFALRFTDTNSGNAALWIDDSTGNTQCSIGLNGSNRLTLWRGYGSTVLATSTAILSPNTWYYIEWKVTIADSITADSCIVRINGVNEINLPAGTDVKNSSNAGGSTIRISGWTNNTYYDDMYVCDLTGTTNNDFLGDCRIDTIFPDAEGTYLQGTPSTGTTHYTLVDETTPNTTDYNSLANVNDRDSYGFANVASLASQQIYAVQVSAYTAKDDAGVISAAPFIRSGSVNLDGPTSGLSTDYIYMRQIAETDPNTSSQWTQTAINSAEFGVVVK